MPRRALSGSRGGRVEGQAEMPYHRPRLLGNGKRAVLPIHCRGNILGSTAAHVLSRSAVQSTELHPFRLGSVPPAAGFVHWSLRSRGDFPLLGPLPILWCADSRRLAGAIVLPVYMDCHFAWESFCRT